MERQAKASNKNWRKFDYSGSQCLKALAEEKIKSILINPNIATIQTDTRFADRVYPLPINTNYVERVIETEQARFDNVGLWRPTALNCGVSLHEQGILKKYDIGVLGTSIRGINITEDRQQFKEAMIKSDVPVLQSFAVKSLEEAFIRT